MSDDTGMVGLEERMRRASRREDQSFGARCALLDLRLRAKAKPVRLGRYTLLRYLGGGATGHVYEAHDPQEGRRVALKVFRDSGPDAEQLLKRESRALSSVSHPNVVTVLEARSDAGVCYLTTELIEGTELTVYVARESEASATGVDGAGFEFPRLRSALYQLASALAALHAAGIVHRDLKPSNVLVTASERLVVLDLGLSRSPDSLQSTFSGRAVGTPAYMAPEQLQRGEVTQASDCYALGVILFEALVGSIPLVAEDQDKMASLRETSPAPRPSDFFARVPADLDELCHDLLDPRPERRPSSAEVLERLGAPLSPLLRKSSLERSDETLFVGRQNELKALNDALRASTARRVAIAIGGPAGIGKSMLVQHFLRSLSPERYVVLAAKCHEHETLPNKTVDALMDALVPFLKRLSPYELQRVLPRHMHELVRMFPSLSRVRALATSDRRTTQPDENEQKQRGLAALSELLARISDRFALILWIDDLQWGDQDSVALIRQLLSPTHAPNCLCIGSFRTETEKPEVLAKRFFSVRSIGASIEVRTLKLSRLSGAEAETLARRLMTDVTDDTVQRVARESEGSPFLIAQLAALTLEPQAAAKASSAERPVTLNEVVTARLTRLSKPAVAVVQFVALAASPLDPRVLLTVTRLNDDSVLHELRTAQLIRTQARSGRVELYHGALAAPILASIAHGAPALHARLARALMERSADEYEHIAFHLRKAGESREAAHYLLLGAERANNALAHRRAARLYSLALAAGVAADRRQAVRVAYAQALLQAGLGLEAARAYLDAARGEPRPQYAFELRRRAAREFLMVGHLEEGRELLESLMPFVHVSLRTPRALALGRLVLQRTIMRVRGVRFRPRSAHEIEQSELTRLDTIWLLGQALVMIDPVLGHELQSRHVLLALRCGERGRVARALALEAVCACYRGPSARPRVDRLLETSREVGAELNDPLTRGTTALCGAASAYFMGEPARALREVEQAERCLREECRGTDYEVATCHVIALGALGIQGAWRPFSVRARQALEEAEARGNLYQSVGLRAYTHLERLVADDVDGARHEIQCAREEWPQTEFHIQHLAVFLGETRVQMYCGNGVAACEHIEAMWPAVARSMLLRAQLVYVEALAWRARAHAMAYAQTRSASFRRAALRHSSTLSRQRYLGAAGHALSVRAAIATSEDDRRAAELFRSSALAHEHDQLPFFAALSRYQASMCGQASSNGARSSADWIAAQREQLTRETGIERLSSIVSMFSGSPARATP